MTGSVGSFPVPAGAKVAENISTSSGVDIMFAKVTPAKVQSFYAQALPTAGDTVTSNSSSSESGGMALIEFTGHGYTGEVTTMAKASGSEHPARAGHQEHHRDSPAAEVGRAARRGRGVRVAGYSKTVWRRWTDWSRPMAIMSAKTAEPP